MSESEKKLISAEGLQKLEDELNDLKVNRRSEIAQKIKEAREQGDLSENAEYDAAKDEQRDIEARIEEIEAILKNVEVIDESNIKEGHIHLGSIVKVHDKEFDEDITFKIVGSTEADSLNNLISNESPIGRALMNKKVGSKVKVETPAGVMEYKILEISR
ncbi:MAG: transcription elongation factor GreA [Eubacterium sp.]|nr:transcription elongation factor GreA [Eubacterium sp.]